MGEEWTQKYLDNRAQSYDNNDQLSICHSKDTPTECTTNRTLFLRRPPILLLLFLLPRTASSIPSPLFSPPFLSIFLCYLSGSIFRKMLMMRELHLVRCMNFVIPVIFASIVYRRNMLFVRIDLIDQWIDNL